MSRKGIISPHLLAILTLIGLLMFLTLSSTLPFKDKLFSLLYPKSSSKAATGPVNPQEIPVKLMVVIYNPIIESRGGQRLTQVMGWQDPRALTNQLIADFKVFTHGIVNYQLVEVIEKDEWPLHLNGRRYDDALYLQETASGNWTLGSGDYNAIIRDNQIEQKVNDGKVDEVFLWGGPGFGWWESAMAGNGAYWINGGPISGVNSKAFVLMGLNYERGLAEAAESYGHRVESIIRRVYGSWEGLETHDWNKFTLLDMSLPGRGGIGNAHNAFNADPGTDYNRSSLRMASTSADDWYNFPNMTGARTDKNCTAWNCDAYQYLKWWYDHMPFMQGKKAGILNNWWRYIADPNQYKFIWKFLPGAEVDYSENNSNLWGCLAVSATCAISDATDKVKQGSSSIKFDTTGAFDTYLVYPSVGGANWDLSSKQYFNFWLYAINPNGAFQDAYIQLKDSSGNYFKYIYPPNEFINSAIGQWKKYNLELDGSQGWTRTASGNPSLSHIDQIELHNDTWGGGFTIYLDGLGFSSATSRDSIAPTVTVASPEPNTTVSGIVPVRIEASDNEVVFRVDLFIDGQYIATDAIWPYIIDWDTNSLSDGTHTLLAKTYDAESNEASSNSVNVSVRISASPPPTPTPTPTPQITPTPQPTLTPTPIPTPTPASSIYSLEAESMTYITGVPLGSSGSIQVFNDSTASNNQGIIFYSNDTSLGNITTLSNTNQVVIRAKADKCRGNPNMVVKVDNSIVFNGSVSSNSWFDYKLSYNLISGSHSINIIFTNDTSSKNCDRNLRVDKVSLK